MGRKYLIKQKTLEKYSNYLMANNQFLDAESYINQIADKEIVNKLSNELNYPSCSRADYRIKIH